MISGQSPTQLKGSEMPDPLIFLDPHVHYWDPQRTPREVSPLVKMLGFSSTIMDWVARRVFPKVALAFYGTPKYVLRPYLPINYQQDCAHHQVQGVVHIEAGWLDKSAMGPVGETRWLEGLGPFSGGRIEAMVVNVDLTLVVRFQINIAMDYKQF